jgi:hypothetical protein
LPKEKEKSLLTIGLESVGSYYKQMFTLKQIQNALWPLINKDANTGSEKLANDFLLDTINEAQKLIKENEKIESKS